MGKHSRESKLSLLILLILYGIADIRSSLPVELTSEEKVPILATTPSQMSTSLTAMTSNVSTTTHATAIAPIPPSDRDRFLTFAESGHHRTFMFAKDNTYIQLDGDIIQRFQLRLCREISFKFRTRLPHGLLVYHNVKNPVFKMQPYALYVIVEKGELKVVHVFGKHLTSVTVGRALNRDEWHSVVVTIDVHGARLIAKVDQLKEEVYLKGLSFDTNYGITDNLTSVILIGGLSSEEKLHGVKYIIESFVGCISDIVLSSGKAASDLLPIVPLIATKHENVKEGCVDKCRTMKNLCFEGSRCINEYNGYRCDCFGTLYEEQLCDVYTATVLTLRGSSYVSYRVYDWKDRVHSANTRVSLHFKTRFDDSALFYASGQIDEKHHYIALSIHQEKVAIQIDLGDGPVEDYLGQNVNNNEWHNLTVILHENTVFVYLDEISETYEVHGTTRYVCIDPEIYICGGPDLYKMKGLKSFNNFAGNLKYVYYNDVSILYELKQNNPKVHYIGVLDPEFEEIDIEVIPITYPFATSHIWWPLNQSNSINLIFDFKTSKNMAVLAYSQITSGQGHWEVRMVKEEIRFELVPDVGKNVTVLKSVKFNVSSDWHNVELDYRKGRIKLTVDYHNKHAQMFGLDFELQDKIVIGSGLKSANLGLIGCMRNIKINGLLIEPRYVINTERVVGEVAIDDCRYVDPCTRPNTCEHGGICSIREDRVICNCDNTGYIGENCHFATFRKTCEELALLGYTRNDVYLIDIDGNGRFPPAHVKCEFQIEADSSTTVVEHNLPSQVDVRSASGQDFSFKIKYREFSAEMLQELISHSLYCRQYIKYDCNMAPLELHSATWFISSSNDAVDFLGNVKRGYCPCGVNATCVNPLQACNCDANENKWHSDEGTLVDPKSLGITEMFFLQQKDLTEEAQGRITLGPLECVETNTQRYVVTFTTSQSYIEVPGWRKGDIAFSFRTTGTSAILLFQPPIRPNYPSFMVALTSEHELTFNFTLNTGTTRKLVINSKRKLNGGEWHKIWIDYNFYHVRFMLNTEYQMLNLLLEEEFGPFEGSMFIGGATADYLKKSTVNQGLIGCFRGLVVNGEVLDIYSYMSVHLSEIIKDCKPSCVPNPCQNKAICKELWSSYECICKNRWAHLGAHCEENINEKALTFQTRESYLKKNYLVDEETDAEKNRLKKMMTENVLMNLRTYDNNALVLYANDNLNNFIHLFINNGTQIIYLFNHEDEIIQMNVTYEKINKGESVQIAIIRTENTTTLHVNENNSTIDVVAKLLTNYTNKPWMNPELEVIRPQRPPAPPTDYFQMNLGGYDSYSLHLAPRAAVIPQGGYVGCVRGFKISDHVVDLSRKAQDNVDQDLTGVLPECNMKCDSEPCKNGGVCTEDFTNQESSCDCELTSYFGEYCMEEKGADFNGESILQRKFVHSNTVPISKVKIKLAFSSNDLRQKNTVLLLVQTENKRSYYLLVAITQDGYLKFEEDREAHGAYGAEFKNRNFLNGARHTVYYTRTGQEARLMIDRIEIPLELLPPQGLWEVFDVGSSEVQIGGLNTTDPRLKIYKGYNGCLSNIFVEINDYIMKPLEEYMLFTRSDVEKVNAVNAQGVRSAQCSADFDEAWPEHELGSTHNGSFLISVDKTWVEDPPSRIPYDSLYHQPDAEEENTDKLFIALIVIFLLGLCYCGYHMWRTQKAYRLNLEKLTDEKIVKSKEMASKLQEPSISLLQLNTTENDNQDGDKKSNGDATPAVVIEVVNEEKPNNRKGSLRFRDLSERWETLEEKDETSENDDEEPELNGHDEDSRIPENEITSKNVHILHNPQLSPNIDNETGIELQANA
ncbi:contactin-associated protein-like 5 isoform X2 [Bombyx mandarina]|uniref:Contactin-associated protein-like 5 isoform X1 n=1 Tax=Bombyx mandarina TaxID=7092 RepID=A0A6J2JLP4_BOMMA|nr:contactin-associated protein-like 5 isoform X1 [Bombyx mandarina]XP_028030556.1 contactin-associated protein-like 5 isoform X2 [Bombyx mandarina]